MAISGDLGIFATLASHPKTHIFPSFSLSSSSMAVQCRFMGGGITFSEIAPKRLSCLSNGLKVRCQSNLTVGVSGDNETSVNSFSQEAETFLLNAINLNFLERLNLAWKIVFPLPKTRKSSNAMIAKQRLKMILFADRCAVSDEAKKKIVKSIVSALSDFVEIESQDKVQLSVSTDMGLGTVCSVTVPVRRVKAKYQEDDETGSITNVDYKDTGPIKDAVTRVRFAPISNNLLISSWDSSVRLLDVETDNLRLEAQTEAAVLDCCFENESIAFSAASDGSVIRYDLPTGTHNAIGQHDDSATCIEYSDETSQVITTGWDRRMLSWDPRSNKVSQGLGCFTSHVESISLCQYELLVATASVVHKYDLRKLGGTVQAEQLSMESCIRCVRSMAGWEGFAVGSVDGRVTLQSNSDEMGYTFRCAPKNNEKHRLVTVNDIAFNPCVPGLFVTGDYEGHVIAWDAKSKKRLMELPRYPNTVASLSYNHTGELLAIASSHTYQEANEIEDSPQIFIQELGGNYLRSASAGSSARKK